MSDVSDPNITGILGSSNINNKDETAIESKIIEESNINNESKKKEESIDYQKTPQPINLNSQPALNNNDEGISADTSKPEKDNNNNTNKDNENPNKKLEDSKDKHKDNNKKKKSKHKKEEKDKSKTKKKKKTKENLQLPNDISSDKPKTTPQVIMQPEVNSPPSDLTKAEDLNENILQGSLTKLIPKLQRQETARFGKGETLDAKKEKRIINIDKVKLKTKGLRSKSIKIQIGSERQPLTANETDKLLLDDKDDQEDTKVNYNITEGLSIMKLLNSNIQGYKKLIIVIFLITILTSLALDALEFSILIMSKCNIQIGNPNIVYISFGFMVILKIIIISCINMELSERCSYKVYIAYLVPLLLYGLVPLFQMPQIVYNHAICIQVNNTISLYDAHNILISMIVLFSIYICYKIIKSLFDIFDVNMDVALIPHFTKILSIVKMVLYIVILIGFNILMIISYWSQITIFLPCFFFDFYIWILLMFGTIISSIQKYRTIKKKKKEDDHNIEFTDLKLISPSGRSTNQSIVSFISPQAKKNINFKEKNNDQQNSQ